jgi:hypothetical protein
VPAAAPLLIQIDAVVRDFQRAGFRVLIVIGSRWLSPRRYAHEALRAPHHKKAGAPGAAPDAAATGGAADSNDAAAAAVAAAPPQVDESMSAAAAVDAAFGRIQTGAELLSDVQPPPTAAAAASRGEDGAATGAALVSPASTLVDGPDSGRVGDVGKQNKASKGPKPSAPASAAAATADLSDPTARRSSAHLAADVIAAKAANATVAVSAALEAHRSEDPYLFAEDAFPGAFGGNLAAGKGRSGVEGSAAVVDAAAAAAGEAVEPSRQPAAPHWQRPGAAGAGGRIVAPGVIGRDAYADSLMAPSIIARWREEGIVFGVAPGTNDDWFWLYAAMEQEIALRAQAAHAQAAALTRRQETRDSSSSSSSSDTGLLIERYRRALDLASDVDVVDHPLPEPLPQPAAVASAAASEGEGVVVEGGRLLSSLPVFLQQAPVGGAGAAAATNLLAHAVGGGGGAGGVLIVSNDFMRDHHFHMFAPVLVSVNRITHFLARVSQAPPP